VAVTRYAYMQQEITEEMPTFLLLSEVFPIFTVFVSPAYYLEITTKLGWVP